MKAVQELQKFRSSEVQEFRSCRSSGVAEVQELQKFRSSESLHP